MSEPSPSDHAPASRFTVFQRYGRQLHAFLVRRLRNPADVDDVAQEVYLRLLRIDDEKCIDRPLQYLYGLAGHVLVDFRLASERAERHIVIDSEAVQEHLEHPAGLRTDELPEQLALQQDLERALAKIPAMHAVVLLAHKRDGHSYEEIAARYYLSPHTVNKYITEARKWLRALLTDRDG